MVIYISYFNSENEKISDIEKKREGIIDYSLSYGNSIIKKEKLISNGTGRIIYNFKDNFLDFDLEINSNCSYNLVLKKYILNESYELNLNNSFEIKSVENNFTANRISEENISYYYITGNEYKDVIDLSHINEKEEIQINVENTITFPKPDKKDDYYLNIIAVQKDNYKLSFLYNPLKFNKEKSSANEIFIALFIFIIIILIVVVIFKKGKLDDAIITEQIQPDIPLVQT